MELDVMRRLARRRGTNLSPWLVLGFGAGLAAGFLLGELFGDDGRRRTGQFISGAWRNARTRAESRASVASRVLAVLSADAELAGKQLELLAIGAGGFELHGWVASRGERTRAYRLAAAAADGEQIVNCLLVRGEDDGAPPLTLDDAPRSA
jgi:hypothetical protein